MTYDFWFVNFGHDYGTLKAMRKFGGAAWEAGRAEAEAEIARLRKALEFYAAPKNYAYPGTYHAIDTDAGKKARAALKEKP